jgi:hypothetical protein
MSTCLRHAGALCLACLLLGACEEKRNAPKPIADAATSATPRAQAAIAARR